MCKPMNREKEPLSNVFGLHLVVIISRFCLEIQRDIYQEELVILRHSLMLEWEPKELDGKG